MWLRILLITICVLVLLLGGFVLFFLVFHKSSKLLNKPKFSKLPFALFLKKVKHPKKLKMVISAILSLILGFLIVIVINPSILTPKPTIKKNDHIELQKNLKKLATEMKGSKPKTQEEDDSDKAPFYEAVTTDKNHYIYYTNISDDANLIQFTDEILAKLRSENKITDETTEYTISFFKDREVAKEYFKVMQDKETTNGKKIIYLSYFIARLQYTQNSQFNQLMRLPNKVIKSY